MESFTVPIHPAEDLESSFFSSVSTLYTLPVSEKNIVHIGFGTI